MLGLPHTPFLIFGATIPSNDSKNISTGIATSLVFSNNTLVSSVVKITGTPVFSHMASSTVVIQEVSKFPRKLGTAELTSEMSVSIVMTHPIGFACPSGSHLPGWPGASCHLRLLEDCVTGSSLLDTEIAFLFGSLPELLLLEDDCFCLFPLRMTFGRFAAGGSGLPAVESEGMDASDDVSSGASILTRLAAGLLEGSGCNNGLCSGISTSSFSAGAGATSGVSGPFGF